MSSPSLGEVRAFSFDFQPEGWLACQGQLLPISSNSALYALIGSRYGGDSTTTFALPKIPPLSSASGEGLGYFIAMEGIFPPR